MDKVEPGVPAPLAKVGAGGGIGRCDARERGLIRGRAALTLVLTALLLAVVTSASAIAGPPPHPAAANSKTATTPGNGKILSWIKDLSTRGYRRTGTPADRRSADYLARHFKHFGLSHVHEQRTRSFRWQAKRSGLKVDGEAISSFPVAHSFAAPGCKDGWSASPSCNGPFSTGRGGLSAPVVDVGDGTAADFVTHNVQGKIVVFNLQFTVPRGAFLALGEWYYDPRHTTRPSDLKSANPYLTNYSDVVQRAIDHGAVGFVGVLADYWNSNKYFPEFTTSGVSISGLWVSPEEGAHIRSLIAGRSAASRANLRLTGKRVPATARTVIGYLPGRSSNTVMVQSHHDAVWDGAVEDASGSAEVLALAKHYSQIPRRQRQKTLMFVLTDSHFTGYQAHRKFVRTYIDNPRAKHRIVANVAVEHVAKQAELGPGRKLQVFNKPEYRGVFENTSDQMKQTIKDAIRRNDLERTVMLPTDRLFPVLGELPTDADTVYQAGVPTVSFISGPLYLYDKADTPDKVYKHDLQPVAKAFAQIVDKLSSTPSAEIGNDTP